MFNISDHPEVQSAIHAALLEDGAAMDATTIALVDPLKMITAHILARHDYVVAGGDVAAAVFHALDKSIAVEQYIADGKDVRAGETLLAIKGKAAPILSGERTALNFMQRMTGIATLTRTFVRAVEGTQCKILDTRKTVPGLRVLDKYSVKCGGGVNHRLGLSDMVLIKDNHLVAAGGIAAAVRKARAYAPHTTRIELEVDTLQQLEEAIEAGADIIGTNCGNGIERMIDIVRELRAAAPTTPILVHANAGLPQNVDGKDVFPDSPEDMARLTPELIEAGANIIGGCCGTTPAHIK
ncbi:MAG: carboxylating nicotinate-nucleotide diphosphorylase, partial [Kiritimatiellaeota bacterium]|nr:carboxylating nicotinate-nucleotide diphosphorylase [Kiritimatiellota bacterium]